MSDLIDLDSPQTDTPFERIRQIDPDGIEFWSARDLMPVLEYLPTPVKWSPSARTRNEKGLP